MREKITVLIHNRHALLIVAVVLAFLVALLAVLYTRGQDSSNTSNTSSTNYTNPSDTNAPSQPDMRNTSGSQVPTSRGASGWPESTTPSSTTQSGTAETRRTGGILSRIASIFRRSESASPTTTATQSLDTKTTDLYVPELRQAPALPTIEIQKHVLTTELPESPTTARIYQRKINYSEAELQAFAKQLGFENVDAIEKGSMLYTMYDLTNKLYLGVNTTTGAFTFYAAQGVKGPNTQGSPADQARAILARAGLDESFLDFGASYQYKDDSTGSLVAEFHRNWDRIGYPIINPLGMLNLTEEQALQDVRLGWQSPYAYTDDAIINASDKQDGLTRPDGFNTLSVRFSPTTGLVYEIASTMPRLLSWEELPTDSLISPITAYNSYVAGNAAMAFTGPAGDGDVTLPEVYSNGSARAREVEVTDFELIYPESGELAMSEWWCPVYALRSFGRVQTGFQAQFAHVVPAVNDPRCNPTASAWKTSQKSVRRTLAQGRVLGLVAQTNTSPTSEPIPTQITTQSSSSLKYGTFAFKDEVIPDTYSNECPTDFNHSYIVEQTPDYIDYVAWIDRSISRQNGTKRRPLASRTIEGPDRTWYFVRKVKAEAQPKLASLSPSFSEGQLRDFRMLAYNNSRQGDPSVAPLDPQFNQLDTIYCQFILTGSPWVHLYAPSQDEFTVSPNPLGGVAYSQPRLTHASWNVQLTQNTPTGSYTAEPLHWEYYSEPITHALRKHYVQHPHARHDGYSIPSSNLTSFMLLLARDAGLTPRETSLLIAELQRPSLQIHEPYVQIHLAPAEFLDTHMSVSIQPTPQTRIRWIFVLEGALHQSILSTPHILAPERVGTTSVETGFIRL